MLGTTPGDVGQWEACPQAVTGGKTGSLEKTKEYQLDAEG